jgi:hypothetical protein
MEEKKYQIGDKIYIQRPLVLGQWRQLNEVAKEVILPDNLDVKSLLAAFGSRLFSALAVIVTEEGRSPRDKDIESLAGEIEFGVTPEEALEIISHFFILNPIHSLLENLQGMVGEIAARIAAIGSMNFASSAAPETLPTGITSSGTLPQEKRTAGPPLP